MTLNEVTYIGLEFHVVWLRSSKGNSGFNISFNNLVSFFTDHSSLSSECFEMRKKCSENHWVRVDGSAVSRRASLSCREFGGVWTVECARISSDPTDECDSVGKKNRITLIRLTILISRLYLRLKQRFPTARSSTTFILSRGVLVAMCDYIIENCLCVSLSVCLAAFVYHYLCA